MLYEKGVDISNVDIVVAEEEDDDDDDVGMIDWREEDEGEDMPEVDGESDGENVDVIVPPAPKIPTAGTDVAATVVVVVVLVVEGAGDADAGPTI